MIRFSPQTQHDDWLLYVAVLPALLTLVAFGATAAFAWHFQAVVKTTTERATDDYVQGLARLGIVKLPGYEPPPSRTPIGRGEKVIADH
jgi:hypothetical protein